MARGVPYLTAALLGAVAVVALAVSWFNLPTWLTVAVGPRESDDYKVISLYARQFSAERRAIRLRVMPVDGAAAAAAALEARKADLAVVRTDVKVPTNGDTVAIMHNNGAFFIAPAGERPADISALRGKTVGVLRGTGANRRMLEVILDQYGLSLADVGHVLLEAKDVEAAVATKRVALVMAVGSVAAPLVIDAVNAVARAGGGAPSFVPVPDAEAIGTRLPVFESLEVLQGAFGGSPPRPARAFTTLGNSHRLMARRELGESAIALLTRLIFASRPAISSQAPSATAIEAPENDKAQVLPVHVGTLAYLEGTEQTFFDRYGDWLYLGVMALSILGSAGALVLGSINRRRGDPQRERLKRVLTILTDARAAESMAEVHDLRGELDTLVAAALADPAVNHDESRLSAFALAVSSARNALSERAGEVRAAGFARPA